MKKSFRIKIDGEEMAVTVERQGDELVVERDGESYRVTLLPNEARIAGEQHGSAERGSVELETPPPAAAPALASPARAAESVSPPLFGRTSGVPAPITGTVKEILVTAGESVSAGERVMMMEAMKMDIEIAAPVSGRVAQIFVKAGDNVRENQPLFRIE